MQEWEQLIAEIESRQAVQREEFVQMIEAAKTDALVSELEKLDAKLNTVLRRMDTIEAKLTEEDGD